MYIALYLSNIIKQCKAISIYTQIVIMIPMQTIEFAKKSTSKTNQKTGQVESVVNTREVRGEAPGYNTGNLPHSE